MRMQERTKMMFAEELESMVKTMPLEKIRVVDLCKRCGATPPTFYYHFHDKYELVAWIFLLDLADICGDKDPDYSSKTINSILKRVEKRRTFYSKAYQENSQNSINRYVQNFNVELGKNALKELTGTEAITAKQLLAIKYHSYGIMGIFKEWLMGDLSISTNDLACFQFEHTPEFLKEALRSYQYHRSNILEQSTNTFSESKLGSHAE